MKALFTNLHSMKKVKKTEAMEIIEELWGEAPKEDKLKMKKLYKYFVELKGSAKPKTLLEMASRFTGKDEWNANILMVKETEEFLYATDTYRLIEIKKNVKDEEGTRYAYKGKYDPKASIIFPDHEGILKDFAKCDQPFVEKEEDTFLDHEKRMVFSIPSLRERKARLDAKMLKEFYGQCEDVKYAKPVNENGMVCFTGKFRGCEVRYLQMPLAYRD